MPWVQGPGAFLFEYGLCSTNVQDAQGWTVLEITIAGDRVFHKDRGEAGNVLLRQRVEASLWKNASYPSLNIAFDKHGVCAGGSGSVPAHRRCACMLMRCQRPHEFLVYVHEGRKEREGEHFCVMCGFNGLSGP